MLLECFHTVREHLLELASEHATLIFELANAVQEGLLDAGSPMAAEELARRARRGREWERRADALLNRMRAAVDRATPTNRVFRRILERADDAADALEEGLFLLSMVPDVGVDGDVLEALRELATCATTASREFVKTIEQAALVHRGGSSEDMRAFLAAADRLTEIEHESDEAEREVTRRVLHADASARKIHLTGRLAGSLEESVDALRLCAALLREHVLGTEMPA